jgi:alkylation response protein AidB-like acyl-CoA dehydrogenase
MIAPVGEDTESTAQFRGELRAWLEANLDDRFRASGSVIGGAGDLDALREWNRKLFDAGYAVIAWPEELGGRGAGLQEQVAYAEEMHHAEAPPTVNPIGIANIAPAIMAWGSAEQQERFLRPMARGDDIWCQGFSEPDAGSDLASLRTTAVRAGDDYVVTGQKVWTSLGTVAEWCELLVRTDPEAPKHAGITCLLVDMSLPGIEARPLRTISGEEEFAELFFDEVRVPVEARLGPENEGWLVAMSTLAAERAGVATLHLNTRRRIDRLVDEARRIRGPGGGSVADEPAVRRRLARLWLEGEHLRLLSERAVSAMVRKRPGAEGSLVKLVWSDVSQHLAEVAGYVLGPDAGSGEWARERVHSRSLSIAGGTTQVNKNIVARRVLGLPRS